MIRHFFDKHTHTLDCEENIELNEGACIIWLLGVLCCQINVVLCNILVGLRASTCDAVRLETVFLDSGLQYKASAASLQRDGAPSLRSVKSACWEHSCLFV